jgi:hypothetical protein
VTTCCVVLTKAGKGEIGALVGVGDGDAATDGDEAGGGGALTEPPPQAASVAIVSAPAPAKK